jgi:hypothetical protein
MEHFLILVGLIGCIITGGIVVFKFLDAVSFFQEFRNKTERTLARIEETLRNQKP